MGSSCLKHWYTEVFGFLKESLPLPQLNNKGDYRFLKSLISLALQKVKEYVF